MTLDLAKAVEILKRYTEEGYVFPGKDHVLATVVVKIRREPNFFRLELKCDSQDLQMVKCEKVEKGRLRPIDVTKTWQRNPLVAEKFSQIREAVLKEAIQATSSTEEKT